MFSGIMLVVVKTSALAGVGLWFVLLFLLVMSGFALKRKGEEVVKSVLAKVASGTLFFLISASCLKYLFL